MYYTKSLKVPIIILYYPIVLKAIRVIPIFRCNNNIIIIYLRVAYYKLL